MISFLCNSNIVTSLEFSRLKNLLLFMVFVFSPFIQSAEAYEAGFHREMTKKAIDNSIASDYLVENLGFNLSQKFTGPGFMAVDIIFSTNTVEDWIIYGSWREDRPLGSKRVLHHFYNPSFPYNGHLKHLTDPPFFGYSPLPCAFDYAYDAHMENWSWEDVKGYYKLALTSTNPDDREENFAKTFRGLGQMPNYPIALEVKGRR